MAKGEMNRFDSSDLFQGVEITRERLYEQVAGRIQDFIVQGGLMPGDRLPPERELARQLGVSRTVIREAIKALQERGLVRVLTGSGTYVSRVAPDVVAQSISLFMRAHPCPFSDLLEIRRLLEVEIAGLAAERGGEEDLRVLESALQEMEEASPHVRESAEGLERFVQADMLFHQALARATKNSLLPILLMPITDLLLEFRRRASMPAGAPESAIRFHRAILDRMRQHDGAGCQEIMREHMREAEAWVQKKW